MPLTAVVTKSVAGVHLNLLEDGGMLKGKRLIKDKGKKKKKNLQKAEGRAEREKNGTNLEIVASVAPGTVCLRPGYGNCFTALKVLRMQQTSRRYEHKCTAGGECRCVHG